MKKMMMSKKDDWSALDDIALDEIAGRITLYRDFAAFRMVCTSWQSSLQNFKFKCRMPWLMLPPKRGGNLYQFFIFPQVEQVQGSITQQHLYIPESDIFPPVQGGITQRLHLFDLPRLTSFSSKGWLLDIVARSHSITILHPFSGAQIKLPQWPKNGNLCIFKFVLSSNPSSTLNYTVMLLYYGGPGRNLIYSKPGDEAWTTINTGQNDYLDVIYFEGKFYTVNSYCQIMACDVTGDNQTMTQVANMPESLLPKDLWDEVYIVESSRGRLLVVTKVECHWLRGRRTRHGRNRKTTYGIYEFQVFEVDLSTNNWTKMKDLGNETLFLGNTSSICIESDGVYFKPNRIFFMDRYNPDAIRLFNKCGGTHVRIYNIEDGSIESYFSGDPCSPLTPSHDWNPTPLFLEQSFY